MIVTAIRNRYGTFDVRIGDIGTFEMSSDAHMPNGVCRQYETGEPPAADGPICQSLPIGIVQAVANIVRAETLAESTRWPLGAGRKD